METKKYEGWCNVQTWLVALWIDNELSSQEYWRAVAEETLKLTGDGSDRLREAQATLADRLQDEIREAVPQETKGVIADLLSNALSQVDWQEIADHLLAEPLLEEEWRPNVWTGPRPGPDTEPKFTL